MHRLDSFGSHLLHLYVGIILAQNSEVYIEIKQAYYINSEVYIEIKQAYYINSGNCLTLKLPEVIYS